MDFLRFFEQVPVDILTALAKAGINAVSLLGELGIDLVKAVLPGGERP